jgi:dTDP-4-amino-4,6-dideoxygalactose transaminase
LREDFLVFGSPLIGQAEIDEVVASLRSGWIGTGPKVARFERMLEVYLGAPHVRCLSSCTASLFLAMRCLGLGPGDEVLVPAMTFVASANAVEHTGATPVFVDSDPATGLMDLEAAEAAVTERTRAIMPVHLAGRPLDLDRVNRLRDKRNLFVVEDAAHAIGAQWNGRPIGSFGNPTAFSFYVTKNITTIEGGAIATDDEAFAARIEQAALHGLSLGAWQRYSDAGFKHYEASDLGFKFNMTDVQAALGIHQLPHLDEFIEHRRRLWERYDTALADLPLSLPAPAGQSMRHARHLYQVRVAEEAPLDRDRLLDWLHRRRIGAGVHYRAVHLHPYYRDRYGIDPASLPVASAISESTLSLPLSPKVNEQDQADVVESLELACAGRTAHGSPASVSFG